MPKRHCEPPRKVSPLRDRCSFETDDEYKQYLAQRRKQQEALRDRQRDRTKRSRPKREREQAERREAAAAQTAAKATAAKAVVVEAARQRAAACGSGAAAGSTHAARVCTAPVHVMCRVDTAYKSKRVTYDVFVYEKCDVRAPHERVTVRL